jgi:hypothetical protein
MIHATDCSMRNPHLLLLIAVAAVLVSSCRNGNGADTLILIDGGDRTGSLEHCTGGVCVLSGTAIPRSTILYIGLGAAMPPPPPIDATRDELRPIDESIHPGPLLSVNATEVVAARARPVRPGV